MTQQTELLNSTNVLTEVIPDTSSSDGSLIIADKKWLARSVFPSIVVTSADSGHLQMGTSFSGGAFSFDAPFTTGKPLISSLTHFTDCLINAYKLIDLVTDELAKRVVDIPEVDPEGGERYRKDERLFLFHDEIAYNVRAFVLDELPRFMVETLGHDPLYVYGFLWYELQTVYQLMFLLSSCKAGFNAPFMCRHEYYTGDEGMPLTVEENYREVSFHFNCARELAFYEDDDFYDFYLPCNLFDYQSSPEDKIYNRYRPLQILSFKDSKPIKKSELCKQVLAEGIVLLACNGVVSRFFAKEVVRCGVQCNNWRGIYKPAINFD